nr:phage holin [uncultured Tyzzerella sp.]
MKTDLKLRMKSPIFWFNTILSFVAPIMVYYKVSIDDFTTWNGILDVVLSALKNPYVLGLAFVSLWNNIVHPTNKNIKPLQ